jgi:hypothetical protein
MPAEKGDLKPSDSSSSADEPIEGEVVNSSGYAKYKPANPLNDANLIKPPRPRSRALLYVILGFLVFIYLTGTILTLVLSHATNSWTGGGNNDLWSNSRNWSLGMPINGQTLVFNLSKVNFKHYTKVNIAGQPGNNSNVALYDNIKNLVVKKLVFTGNNPSLNNQSMVAPATIGGDALGVTNQIVNYTNHYNIVTFDNQLNLTKGVLINNIPIGSGIFFYGTVNIGRTTVHLQTNQAYTNSSIDFYGPLIGNGSIIVDPYSDIIFPGTSPQLSGSTTISYGAVVHLGETTTSTKGYVSPTNVDGLGNSDINILNGGNLELDAAGEGDYGGAGSTQFTVPNNITMTGSGTTYTLRSDVMSPGAQGNNTGSLSGAITSCIAPGQDGCSGYLSGQGLNTVTFTGQVTLVGNAQIGVITENNGDYENPPMYSYTIYIFKKPVVNIDKYTLTDVPNSQIQITDR